MMQYNGGLPFAESVVLSKAALSAAQVLEPRETMESAVGRWSRPEGKTLAPALFLSLKGSVPLSDMI